MSRDELLNTILRDVKREVAEAKARIPLVELEKMIAGAPPVRPLQTALRGGFGIIAEIKERAPSRGAMRRENVAQAPRAYDESPLVKAVSVLTNRTHFSMSIERLGEARAQIHKPVLRKEFVIDEYQIYEARAFGADAILLMANVLSNEEMLRFYELARSLQLDVLFETHTAEQIEAVPDGAAIFGINCREFRPRKFLGIDAYKLSRIFSRLGSRDLSTHYGKFDLIDRLPPHAIKVAESGVNAQNAAAVRDKGFDAILIGNSLLLEPEGIAVGLARLETALDAVPRERFSTK